MSGQRVPVTMASCLYPYARLYMYRYIYASDNKLPRELNGLSIGFPPPRARDDPTPTRRYDDSNLNDFLVTPFPNNIPIIGGTRDPILTKFTSFEENNLEFGSRLTGGSVRCSANVPSFRPIGICSIDRERHRNGLFDTSEMIIRSPSGYEVY